MELRFAEDGWDEAQVRAAGGIVTRAGAGGERELALVHRPQYDDWSLPKGKLSDDLEPGEAAALREVEEETGMTCALVMPVGSTRYRDGQGRSKVVRYWEMVPRQSGFRPNSEVDELAWFTAAQAAQRLTYAHDQTLVLGWAGSEEGEVRPGGSV